MFYRDAEDQRQKEFQAVLKIQSWFRGTKVRAYFRYVWEQDFSAVDSNLDIIIVVKPLLYIINETWKHCRHEITKSNNQTLLFDIFLGCNST